MISEILDTGAFTLHLSRIIRPLRTLPHVTESATGVETVVTDSKRTKQVVGHVTCDVEHAISWKVSIAVDNPVSHLLLLIFHSQAMPV